MPKVEIFTENRERRFGDNRYRFTLEVQRADWIEWNNPAELVSGRGKGNISTFICAAVTIVLNIFKNPELAAERLKTLLRVDMATGNRLRDLATNLRIVADDCERLAEELYEF